MNGLEIVKELQQRGWTQGSLVRVKSPIERSWLTLKKPGTGQVDPATRGAAEPPAHSSGTWALQREQLDGCEMLVVISQICDLLKPPEKEPAVDALATYWTSDKDRIKSARTNSPRYFVLQTRETSDGRQEALVADAAQRVTLEKASLAEVMPITAFTDQSLETVRRFQNWLADRFGRQPLPDDLVKAVQRPIVNAVRKLKETDERQRILDKIDFVLCRIVDSGPPLQVEMLFVSREASDEPSFTFEEAAKIAAWFDEAVKANGKGALAHWERYTTLTISVYYYENSYELALGEFSLLDEEALPDTAATSVTEPPPTKTTKQNKGRKRRAS